LHLLWLCRQIRSESYLLFLNNTLFGSETFYRIDEVARSLNQEYIQAIRAVKLLRYKLVVDPHLEVFASLERVYVSFMHKTNANIARLVQRFAGKPLQEILFDHRNEILA